MQQLASSGVSFWGNFALSSFVGLLFFGLLAALVNSNLAKVRIYPLVGGRWSEEIENFIRQCLAFSVLALFGSLVLTLLSFAFLTWELENKDIDEGGYDSAKNICNLRRSCNKYADYLQSCAAAGSVDACVGIKMGSDNSILSAACTNKGEFLFELKKRWPTDMQCYIIDARNFFEEN